ncbi:alpha/beta fold hydrolase [Lentzea nigeriaca]|uniref:alpha/beta fold hydrolase n=1 Tax=Lentzea nigeriaca TaxID=1128665 RepID=UPI00195D28C9|nr:alpha/beta fold hydrolase [Lentzea nigeriaca]MBM7863113.1 pimeloyl-ACP methyl ester carboxylesterase [Lentzea nigeriaca]
MTSPTAQITARRLELADGTVSYFHTGQGRPTLFLHSAGEAARWLPVHDRLSAVAELIAPDHPGFGRTTVFPALESVSDLARHYVTFLDELSLDRVDVVGVSFGGWVAAELAAHAPSRVAKMVLMAPVGLHVPGNPVANLFAMSSEQVIRSLFHNQAIADAILAMPPAKNDIVAYYRDFSALARFGFPDLSSAQLEGRLAGITAPARVIAAGNDRVVPREHCDRYAAAIPGAELVSVDDCGHALYGERPDEVATAVIAHLAN